MKKPYPKPRLKHISTSRRHKKEISMYNGKLSIKPKELPKKKMLKADQHKLTWAKKKERLGGKWIKLLHRANFQLPERLKLRQEYLEGQIIKPINNQIIKKGEKEKLVAREKIILNFLKKDMPNANIIGFIEHAYHKRNQPDVAEHFIKKFNTTGDAIVSCEKTLKKLERDQRLLKIFNYRKYDITRKKKVIPKGQYLETAVNESFYRIQSFLIDLMEHIKPSRGG